jgi:hypothetical protein
MLPEEKQNMYSHYERLTNGGPMIVAGVMVIPDRRPVVDLHHKTRCKLAP